MQSDNSHLNNSIQLILKDTIGFFYLTQWEAVRNEWSGVNLSLLNQAEDFLAIASVHTTSLEGEVLTIHFG